MRFKLYEGRRTIPHTKAEMSTIKKEPAPASNDLGINTSVKDKPDGMPFQVELNICQTGHNDYNLFYSAKCTWNKETGECLFKHPRLADEGNNSIDSTEEFNAALATFNLYGLKGIPAGDLSINALLQRVGNSGTGALRLIVKFNMPPQMYIGAYNYEIPVNLPSKTINLSSTHVTIEDFNNLIKEAICPNLDYIIQQTISTIDDWDGEDWHNEI